MLPQSDYWGQTTVFRASHLREMRDLSLRFVAQFEQEGILPAE